MKTRLIVLTLLLSSCGTQRCATTYQEAKIITMRQGGFSSCNTWTLVEKQDGTRASICGLFGAEGETVTIPFAVDTGSCSFGLDTATAVPRP